MLALFYALWCLSLIETFGLPGLAQRDGQSSLRKQMAQLCKVINLQVKILDLF